MITPGFCIICNHKIHTECGTCGVKKFNDQYTEVEMTWSNGSKMKVGVCVHCASKSNHNLPQHKEAITRAHHDHWEESGATPDRTVILV